MVASFDLPSSAEYYSQAPSKIADADCSNFMCQTQIKCVEKVGRSIRIEERSSGELLRLRMQIAQKSYFCALHTYWWGRSSDSSTQRILGQGFNKSSTACPNHAKVILAPLLSIALRRWMGGRGPFAVAAVHGSVRQACCSQQETQR